ncbi:MAG: hypothetical protein ACK559_34400, partial [bacterium]
PPRSGPALHLDPGAVVVEHARARARERGVKEGRRGRAHHRRAHLERQEAVGALGPVRWGAAGAAVRRELHEAAEDRAIDVVPRREVLVGDGAHIEGAEVGEREVPGAD